MTRINNFIKEVITWYFPKQEEKVFCIGLHKTGTTSLAKALTILGYRVVDYPSIRLLGNRFLWLKGTQLNDYNCFTDATIVPLYKKLDKKFPNSKFILTTRSIDSWLDSCSKWPNFLRPNVVGKRKIYRERVLGDKNYNEEAFKRKYNEHYEDVMKYFKSREDDLLELDIAQDNKWEDISAFLNKPIPDSPYPHSNSGVNKRFINEVAKDLNINNEYKELAFRKFHDAKNLDKNTLVTFFKSLR